MEPKYTVLLNHIVHNGKSIPCYLIIFDDCQVAQSYEKDNAELICKLLNKHEAENKRQKRTGYTQRNCNICNKSYMADNRNLKRGWGKTCSKSCAAKLRERSKPGYNPETVARNNAKRNGYHDTWYGIDEDPGWDSHKDTF